METILRGRMEDEFLFPRGKKELMSAARKLAELSIHCTDGFRAKKHIRVAIASGGAANTSSVQIWSVNLFFTNHESAKERFASDFEEACRGRSYVSVPGAWSSCFSSLRVSNAYVVSFYGEFRDFFLPGGESNPEEFRLWGERNSDSKFKCDS